MVLPPELVTDTEGDWRIKASFSTGRYTFSLSDEGADLLHHELGFGGDETVSWNLYRGLVFAGDSFLPSAPSDNVAAGEDLVVPNSDVEMSEREATALAERLQDVQLREDELTALTAHAEKTRLGDHIAPEAMGTSDSPAKPNEQHAGTTEADDDPNSDSSDQLDIAERVAAETDTKVQTVAKDLRKLSQHGIGPERAAVSLTERYGTTGPTVFDIVGVGRLRGHCLLESGFATPEAVATSSLEELKEVSYLGDHAAPTVLKGAREFVETESSPQPETDVDDFRKESRSPVVEIDRSPGVDAGVYPETMTTRDQWLVWKPTEEGQKVPRAPWTTDRALRYVSATDPGNWTDFESARDWAEKLHGNVGVAFALTADDPIVFLDYDDVRTEGSTIVSEVREHIESASSYAAVSTSGNGVHIFVEGSLSEDTKALVDDLSEDDGSIEVYERDRFVAITGAHLAGTPSDVQPAPEFLDGLEEDHATIPRERPDPSLNPSDRSVADFEDVDATDTIQDIFDAIAAVDPSDITLRSSLTEKRADGSRSYDPSWVDSDSGTRLAALSNVWVYRKGMVALDALQVVALEEGIIRDVQSYPSGSNYWEAVESLRGRGVSIPKFDRYDDPVETASEMDADDTPSEPTATATDPSHERVQKIINRGEPVRTWVHPYDRTYYEETALRLTDTVIEIADELDLSAPVSYEASKLFAKAQDADAIQGGSMKTSLAAAFRIIGFEAGEPRPLELVADAIGEKPGSVRNAFYRIVQQTDISDRIDANTVLADPAEYVPYMIQRLDRDPEGPLAEDAIQRVEAHENTPGSPWSEAAAAIYAASTVTDIALTQKEIAYANSITPVTIRNHYQRYLSQDE